MMDKSDESSIISLINKQYLKNEDADEEQFRVRLKQTAYDNDVYKSIVEENIMTKKTILILIIILCQLNLYHF